MYLLLASLYHLILPCTYVDLLKSRFSYSSRCIFSILGLAELKEPGGTDRIMMD